MAAALLQFISRENGEDCNVDFTVMLNTREGAVKHLDNSRSSSKSAQTSANRWISLRCMISSHVVDENRSFAVTTVTT
jgi:hypothetical protein